MKVVRVYVVEFTYKDKGYSFICDRAGNPEQVTIQYLKCKSRNWMKETVRAIEVLEESEEETC